MKLCDMHCDTAMALYHRKASLYSNDCCHISLERAAGFEKYLQLAAFFTSPQYGDEEGWEVFLASRENFLAECKKNSVPVLQSAAEVEAWDSSDEQFAFILTIEDARILAGHTERVKELYDMGIRVVTPLWGGDTVIGGSHDTENGLTDFGREAVSEMLRVGIIPDVSHASFRSTDEILDLCEAAGKVPVATHMNAYDVHAHTRNLTDERFKRLVKLGGCVGVSLCPPHLTADEEHVTSLDAARHILHYHAIAPKRVGFGCDLDGTHTPPDIPEISALPVIADRLRENGMTEEEIEDVYYRNEIEFLKANLPK